MQHHTVPRIIVVGFDGSSAGARALDWAIGEARRGRDIVRAVMVLPHDDLLPGTAFALQPHGRRPVTDEAEARECLHTSVLAADPEPTAVIESVVAGDPATELLKEAAGADLLVVGGHGHGPFARRLLGSVAAHCLRRSSCPVVVLPPS